MYFCNVLQTKALLILCLWEGPQFWQRCNFFHSLKIPRQPDFPKITLERSKCFPTAGIAHCKALVGLNAPRCWDKPMCIFPRTFSIDIGSFLGDIFGGLFALSRANKTFAKVGLEAMAVARSVLIQWIKGVQGLMGNLNLNPGAKGSRSFEKVNTFYCPFCVAFFTWLNIFEAFNHLR